MSDLRFYEIPLKGRSSAGSRIVRKLSLPFFTRLTTILEAICGRLEVIDRRFEVMTVVDAETDIRLSKVEFLNSKLDSLNRKLDLLNQKCEALNLKFEAILTRQGELEDEVSSVGALHWDHVAIARRLAQLEDRFINASESSIAPDEPGSSIPFPGFERMGKDKVG